MTSDNPGLEIDCRTVVELLTDYLEGALDDDTEQRLTAHLALCPPCLYYLDQIKATIDLSGPVDVDTLSAETRDGLLSAFRDWSASETG